MNRLGRNFFCKIKNKFIKTKETTETETEPENYPELFKKIIPQNPVTFNEKIKWLSVYDATPLKTQLADKYLARDWIKEQIGEEYLVPLLGVWDSFEQIKFKTLPDKFILKCNHSCGKNIIVKDKKSFDKKRAKRKFNEWLKQNFALRWYELHYFNIKPMIIAEKLLEPENGEPLYDYRIHCLGGKPEWIKITNQNLPNRPGKTYDPDWQLAPFQYGLQLEPVPKPKNLDKMLELATKLSKPFNFVRVDLYNVDGQIYFGEMTFTPAIGGYKIEPQEYDTILGDLLTLPEPKIYVEHFL